MTEFQVHHSAVQDSSIYYNMKHNKRGHAVVFLYNLEGEEKAMRKDEDKIKETLKHLCFDEPMICEDFSREQIQAKLEEVAKMDHTNNDCLLVIIRTHGNMVNEREILGTYKDGIAVDTIEPKMLRAPFKPDKSPSLMGKPKLFFVQACRGPVADLGVDVPKDFTDYGASTKTSTDVDFLTASACASGTMSYGTLEEGSIFIQTLCEELIKEGQDNDLVSILTKTTNAIDQLEGQIPVDFTYPVAKILYTVKQTLETTSTLKKKVVFLPK